MANPTYALALLMGLDRPAPVRVVAKARREVDAALGRAADAQSRKAVKRLRGMKGEIAALQRDIDRALGR